MNKKCQELTTKGTVCNIPCLKGENKCLYHSKSEQAKKFKSKGGKIGKHWMSDEELLRFLTKELKKLDKVGIKEPELTKMKMKYFTMIIEVKARVERIGELERKIKKLVAK